MAAETCGWCDAEAVTELIIAPGRKHKKTAPCCEKHAKEFEERGLDTTRVELDRKMQAAANKSQWVRRT